MTSLDILLIIIMFCLICSIIIITLFIIFFKTLLKNQENKLISRFSEILTNKKIDLGGAKNGRIKKESISGKQGLNK
jgi:Na+-transporting NADH:ubiquinone oxidoreductase subunit NqrC